ncbi:hypothetical protein MRX96_037157 [Rhipicephalus microplus]
MHLIRDQYFYSKVEVRGDTGEAVMSLQKNGLHNAEIQEVLDSKVNEGDIFSFGLQYRAFNELVGFANDNWGSATDQGKINVSDYRFKMFQGNHVLLSLHVTAEDDKILFYPPNFLQNQYSIQPPGSFMIAELQIENPDEE